MHFATGNYTRAQAFLAKHDLITRNASCRYLAAHCLIKQARFPDALDLLGDRNPTHLIANAANKRKSGPRAPHPPGNPARPGPGGDTSDRRYEAAMCYLRGLCFARQNAFDRAKECYKDAVMIDVQCFEAFRQLMQNSLMAPDEEWAFLESLDFDSVALPTGAGADREADPSAAQEAAEFTRMLYTTRLSKYRNPAEFTTAYDSLSTHYQLASNPDLLLARADLLFTQCRYRDALGITEAIVREDRYNFAAYPLHLACLYELRMRNELFLVAHDLADAHPDEPVSWLAVGTYYFATERVPEARRYFSKASTMDVHFGPAWIGFAHTFAAEGEHDQAISAYSTAARLFMGTHLPQVFLGMQNHALNNMALAEEFLRTAHGLCASDPLLLNEMGVVKFHQDRPREAAAWFERSLKVAGEIGSEPAAWLAARTNFAHALRRLGQFSRALAEFDEVLRLGGRDAPVLSAKGLILLEVGRAGDAVAVLHEALAASPQDGVATELLGRALEETGVADAVALDEDGDLGAFEEVLRGRMAGKGKGRAGGILGSPGEGILASPGEASVMEISDDE